jgi:hypothetical protein
MAVREIKTSIALDGEQAFKQALADASRNLRVMDADLKAAATEFKVTGDAQQYYTEKSRNLKEQIAQQEQVVDMLVNAVRKSAAAFGESDAKTDGWRIKLSNATAKLMTMKKSLQDTDKEAEEFGRDSRRVGKQIEDGIGDGAEEANKSVKDLIESMQQDIGTIKGSVGFQIATSVTQNIIGAVQGVMDFVQSNQEYRRAMAQFEQAALKGNHDVESMKSLLNSIGAVTGDFDSARETVIALMQTGMTGEWMNNATDIFKVINMLYGDAINMATLAQDFQKTVAKGKADGQVIDLIEREGLSEDAFNKLMEDAGTTEAKSIAALTYLAPKGYKPLLEEYNEKTKNIQAAAKAQMELADAWAEVAETLEPLTTSITMLLTKVVEGLGSAVRLLMGDVKGYAEELGMTEEEFRLETTKKTGNAGWQNDGKTFRFDEVGDALKNIAIGIFSGGESTGAKDAGEAAGQEYATALADAASSALLDDESLQNAIDLLTSGWTLGGEDEAAKRLEQLGLTDEQKQQVIDEMGKLGMDMSDSLDTSLTDGMNTAGANAAVAGQNVGISAQNGLSKGFAAAYITTVDWVNRINAAAASLGSGLGAVPTYGLSNGGYFGGTLGRNRLSVTIPLNINGREVARATASDISAIQGQQSSRASRLP